MFLFAVACFAVFAVDVIAVYAVLLLLLCLLFLLVHVLWLQVAVVFSRVLLSFYSLVSNLLLSQCLLGLLFLLLLLPFLALLVHLRLP